MKKILIIVLLVALVLSTSLTIYATSRSDMLDPNTMTDLKGIWYHKDTLSFIEITDTHVNVGYPYSEYLSHGLIKDIKTVGTIQEITVQSFVFLDVEDVVETELVIYKYIGSDDFIIFNKTSNFTTILETEYMGKDLNDFYDNYFPLEQ